MDHWIKTSSRLKYMVGEVTLFSVFFRVLMYDVHFTNLAVYPDIPSLPELIKGELDAAVIPSQPIDRTLDRIQVTSGFIRYIPTTYGRYYTNLQSGTFQDYLKKFSSKSRSMLLRKIRKFAEYSGGTVQWKEYRTCEQMAEFLPLAHTVSQKTYQEKLLHSGLPQGQSFHDRMLTMAHNNLVRGYLLFAHDTPIAYILCPIKDGILFYQHVGYDPEYRQWSPGTILQYHVLESLFAEGCFRMFDFTQGQGPHKEFFSTDHIRCADMQWYRYSIRNYVLIRIHALLSDVSRSLVRTLDKYGLKSRLKQWFRRR